MKYILILGYRMLHILHVEKAIAVKTLGIHACLSIKSAPNKGLGTIWNFGQIPDNPANELPDLDI